MLDLLKFAATTLGNFGLWVALYNQMNASNMRRSSKKVLERLVFPIGCSVITLLAFCTHFDSLSPLEILSLDSYAANMLGAYAVICWIFLAFAVGRWCVDHLLPQRTPEASDESTESIDVAFELGLNPTDHWFTKLFSKIPGNQIFRLSVTRKVFSFEELPEQLDGLKIAHLSDLHFTGHIDRAYFEYVVAQTNQRRPDMIVITGDLVDKEKCLDWIEPLLGKLDCPLGVYYVLGNHDQRIKDTARYRKRLKNAGLVGVNGRWQNVDMEGATLWVCGNEAPWYPGAEKIKGLPKNFDAKTGFSLCLSHSPDQLDWARRRKLDLVLAGHTHGGQIRIPVIGPIVSPSRYGVRFASGIFKAGKTLMHVSRGVSGVHPIRLRCEPELAFIELRRQASVEERRSGAGAATKADSGGPLSTDESTGTQEGVAVEQGNQTTNVA